MKHLIEAERESSVPSSNPITSDGYSAVQLDASFEAARDTSSVSLKAHRIIQITLLGDRIRAFSPRWRSSRLARSGDFFI